MSNQFYKYVSELLIGFFKEEGINPGDRYFIQLEQKEELKALIDSLQTVNGVKKFTYQHEFGAVYETFAVTVNNVDLVVASTAENVTPDFLVTLRNEVGDQKGDWEGTALISLVSEQLDSIQGGSSDLQKEGMPLHPQSLFNNLRSDIENSELKKVDQTILFENLERLMEEQVINQVALLDFEEIFSVLSKGSIKDNDYQKFGLFKDYDLHTYTGKKLKNRLKENHELFEYVQRVHDFGTAEQDLEKKFSQNGVSELKKDNWVETPFTKVYNYAEEKEDENKNAKVKLEDLKIPNMQYWDRPLRENSTGYRKRQIIIFNNEKKDEFTLSAKFEISGKTIKNLDNEFISIPNYSKSNVAASAGRKNLTITIRPDHKKPTFSRVSYKHEKKSSLGCEFHIVVVPFGPEYLGDIKTKYVVNVKDARLELNSEVEELKLGFGKEDRTHEITTNNSTLTLDENEAVTIQPQADAFNEKDQLIINLIITQVILPILLKNELPETTPIRAVRIWRMKRELQDNFQLIQSNRLVIGNREFYTHAEYTAFFAWEKEWVNKDLMAARVDADELSEVELTINEDLKEAFSRFRNYFTSKGLIPSLCYVSDDMKTIAVEYIQTFINEIRRLKNEPHSWKARTDLMLLGTQKTADGIYFTPFHPLVIAYQLKVNDMLGKEEVDQSILNRLNPDALVPYIYDNNGDLFKPDSDQPIKEWVKFKTVNEVTVADASTYLARVTEDKLKQFEEHFSYLFAEKSKASFKVNVVNISNDREVLRGILLWIVNRIERKGAESLKPIEVSLYLKNSESSFDIFSRLKDPEKVSEYFNVRLSSKKYDEHDLLRFIRESLFYYKHSLDEPYRYAHVSFYKMQSQEDDALQHMDEMATGISLNGLVASVPSMKVDDHYRNGFGTKAYDFEHGDILLDTTYYTNELAANVRNKGNDTYRPEESISSRTTTDDEETLNKIFASSYWVTFVDPSVDLAFFQEYNRNLVVIHYSDQYSSSSRYDAITVTDKSRQYNTAIKEYLMNADFDLVVTEEDVVSTIKAFNAFNGEWLLRIIGSKGHFSREKLSIISAIKNTLAYFDHKDILWVPISLEEILRVAGAVGLDRKNGIFTAKNLGISGAHSDDLLLIGLETASDGIKVHFYPIEVKIGINNSQVIEKAKKQVDQTKKLFDEELRKYNDDGKVIFTNQFYRNFFVQLTIANASKIYQSGLWPEKEYNIADSVKAKLLKDDYEITDDLAEFIGRGAIVSFEKDRYVKKSEVEDDVTILYLAEEDGYRGIIDSVQLLTERMIEGKTDFRQEILIGNVYKVEDTANKNANRGVGTGKEEYPAGATSLNNDSTRFVPPGHTGEQEPPTALVEPTNKKVALEDVRILIGEVENSNKEVYWEFGHPQLANRHLLISGKSGQGKTYFMQCLLLEQAKQGISNIIVDYTEGFLPNQLEPEFVDYLGDKLIQKIVYNEQLPINPFRKNTRNIGGLEIAENDTDIAERIKSVFGAVYSTLGIQQLNAIYEATQNGIRKYEDEMSLKLLASELEELGSTYATSALSQIRPLIDRNPFNAQDFATIDWEQIINSEGQVYVIQLTGYPRDVQLIITEFILWDLWNHSVRHGSKNKPLPVILDEAQNLDHREFSPSARILTEGRKFGWSAWYATQFLRSQLESAELARLQNSSQKVYFAPPEQEVSTIAHSIAQDKTERGYWEKKLSSLRKGQCIVHGPLEHNGELTKPNVNVVNISPLGKRINRS
ncbi:DNA phosphorothioation-dependent restriction protein DptH [Halalkalibacter okhensis]|uniref:DNA phosphorothioation-dependent restriction protein DptH n=1 Tax=Halalkalibacter okhensis TaxID=333138 RepID=A0A0B0IG30_9BACI|nr:DNA phosphorothioation-dependent restriction protein DptH [Halalkalibacter okhensis]KHF41548.1 DNA phosphorothioation-dependent restriction protein DptH [Halalkalibacter okhensis]